VNNEPLVCPEEFPKPCRNGACRKVPHRRAKIAQRDSDCQRDPIDFHLGPVIAAVAISGYCKAQDTPDILDAHLRIRIRELQTLKREFTTHRRRLHL